MEIGISDLTVAYDGIPAVRRLTAGASSGTWLALIGPNGAGKTTVLRAIAGLVRGSGTIRLGDESVSGLQRRRIAQLVAYVPQRPILPEALSVVDYVLLGRTPYISYLGIEGADDVALVGEMLKRLDLTTFAGRSLASLSGGEAQRAVLARALAQQAPVLLLDEPTAALDVGHQQRVLELIDELRLERRLTVMASMHDLSLAGQFAERILLLSEGRLAAEGSPEEVLTHANIREHFGASVRIDRDVEGRVLVVPARLSRTAVLASLERR